LKEITTTMVSVPAGYAIYLCKAELLHVKHGRHKHSIKNPLLS